MSVVRKSSQINASVASSNESQDDVYTIKVKRYVKDLLKSRIFLGRYLERRLVDKQIGYRDVVLISAAETDFKRDLIESHDQLRTICPGRWIGITDNESNFPGVCIWTEIENQLFGPFWFQIRNLRFREDEIILTVKCLRFISDSFLELEPLLTGESKKLLGSNEGNAEMSVESLSVTYQDIVATVKSALSISNVKEFVTFLFAFIIAIFTGSASFVNFIGTFVLALIREISIFIKNSTPMFLGFLDFLSKIVGGFYILLAMFFKPSNPPPQNKRSIPYYDGNRQEHYRNQFDSRYID